MVSRSQSPIALFVAILRVLPVWGSELDVILYGATGCVGHFAAEHLGRQAGLRWAIAGRTKDKLDALRVQLDQVGANVSRPDIIVADLTTPSRMRSWVSRARAVITAAGPFSIHNGEALVQTCAEAGVHYVDSSDEFYWQRWMIDKYDAMAKSTGAKIVLAGGFCVLAADLGAQLAINGLVPDAAGVKLDAWLETYNGGLSAGVINTGKAIHNASYPKVWDTDPYVLAPDALSEVRVDSSVEGMTYPQWISGEGLVVKNLFGEYDARLLRRTFTSLGQKVALRVGSAASMYPKWTGFIAAHPGSWSKLSQCPSESVFEDGSWAYRFKVSGGATTREVLLSGNGDPGYKFTAQGLAETGLCLAGKTAGCMEGTKGGVMTSMSALNPQVFQQRLQTVGLLEMQVVASQKSFRTLK